MTLDRWTPLRALVPGAWASLAVLQSCAQVVHDASDAGVADLPHITDVQPQPGPIAGDARFRVVFSAPMDLALLLVEPSRSDTVVLVPAANAELIAAAIAHGKLSSQQRALTVAADAEVAPDGTDLALTLNEPLAPGAYALLVSSRLKDAEGRRMPGNGARFSFEVAGVADAGPLPRLEAPLPGSTAPLNLRRVRVSFPDGPPAGAVALLGPDGGLVAGPAASDGGSLALEIEAAPSSPGCSPLCPGEQYSLALAEQRLPGATFAAANCARSDPPRLLAGSPDLRVGDTWVDASAQLDWPGLLHLEVQELDGPDGGACAVAPAAVADVLASCAPAPCADAGTAAPGCAAQVRLRSLHAATSYALRLAIEDDEGNRADLGEHRFQTLAALPASHIDEVMASPPLPTPRSDGEYIEIVNDGPGTIDAARLLLEGPDGRARPLLEGATSSQVLLPAGARALAVGSSFDEARYALPPGTPVLRAGTLRLLGRGLADQPPAIRLLWMPPEQSQDGGAAVEIDQYPGNGPTCALGRSLERDPPGDAGVAFHCGADGGSPGRAW